MTAKTDSAMSVTGRRETKIQLNDWRKGSFRNVRYYEEQTKRNKRVPVKYLMYQLAYHAELIKNVGIPSREAEYRAAKSKKKKDEALKQWAYLEGRLSVFRFLISYYSQLTGLTVSLDEES
jgi:hypothetical protein